MLPALEAFYASESNRIRQAFDATGDGAVCLRERSNLVDSAVVQLYRALFPNAGRGPYGFCVAAVGGYGRQELFPFSDVDLLFLGANAPVLQSLREPIATLSRHLWDLRMRVGHSTRALAECGQLHADNLEFTVSLLDARWLAGDAELFASLQSRTLLHLIARDRQDITHNLVQVTHDRHSKHGRTIFHLEPNIKEAPGGLRDYHVARWLSVISDAAERGKWTNPEEEWPGDLKEKIAPAFRFLS
ncbi:MAG: [protein-PII] uridylyltransferase, partial [Terriglobia bacterium]